MPDDTDHKGQLREWIARLFHESDGGDMGDSATAAAEGAPGGPVDGSPFEELRRRMAVFLSTVDRSGQPVTAGAVQLIGLSAVRERLGDRWDKFADRVHGVARAVIEKHLSDGDVYSLYEDDSYIILFPRLSEELAKLKAKMIGDAISHQLLGDVGAGEAISVKTLVYAVDGGVDLDDADDGTLMDRLFTRAQEQLDAEGDGPRKTPDGSPEEASLPSSVKLAYRPIWNVRKNMVSGFLAGLRREPSRPADPALCATRDTDCHILRQVKKELEEIIEGGSKKILIVPVHLYTLINASSKKDYLEICRSINPDCRNYLVFEIILPQDKVIYSNLDKVSIQFGGFARSFICRVHIDFNEFEQLDDRRLLAIGMSLPPGRIDERKIAKQLDYFAKRAGDHGILCYLHDVPSLSLMTVAIASGFSFLDGKPLGSIVKSQFGAYRFGIEDLYAPRIRQN